MTPVAVGDNEQYLQIRYIFIDFGIDTEINKNNRILIKRNIIQRSVAKSQVKVNAPVFNSFF